MDQYDREMDEFDRQLDDGTLTPEEHRQAVKKLHQDYRAAAEEAAEQAYCDELSNW